MIVSSRSKSVQAGHAEQPRAAVDLGRAGAALAGLAVPAHGQVAGLGRLDAVDGVQHDLAVLAGHGVVAQLAAVAVAAPQTEVDVIAVIQGFSSNSAMRSSGRSSSGSRLTATSPSRGPDDHLDLAQLRVGLGVVVAGVAAAALAALQRGQGHALGHGQQRAQVEGQVPARVVLAVPLDPHLRRPLLEGGDPLEGALQLALGADDPDQLLHAVLELLLDGVGVDVAVGPLERGQGLALGRLDLGRGRPPARCAAVAACSAA